jgi:hypothetical protein
MYPSLTQAATLHVDNQALVLEGPDPHVCFPESKFVCYTPLAVTLHVSGNSTHG